MARSQRFPRLPSLYSYSGDDDDLGKAAVAAGAKGLVIAGTGAGHANNTRATLKELYQTTGVVVVRSARVEAGRVVRDDNWQEPGFVAADNLLPQKARILLQLGLTRTSNPDELQRMFDALRAPPTAPMQWSSRNSVNASCCCGRYRLVRAQSPPYRSPVHASWWFSCDSLSIPYDYGCWPRPRHRCARQILMQGCRNDTARGRSRLVLRLHVQNRLPFCYRWALVSVGLAGIAYVRGVMFARC